MNARDHSLYERLHKQIGDIPRPGLLLLDVATTQFVVVELVLLKALIGNGNSGLFISVDRPHQYMVHLLDMHKIERNQLSFIDAVSQFSQGDRDSHVKVDFLKGPSHIDELPEVLSKSSATGNDFDISRLQFALIDNVSILMLYNSRQAVESFLDETLKLLSGRMAVVLVIDRKRFPDLYQAALSMGGGELRLDPQAAQMAEQVPRANGHILDGGK